MKIRAGLAVSIMLYMLGGLASVIANETPVGNVSAGKEIYMGCSGCHGVDAMGNEALKAPRLAGQKAWYTVTQLNNFRSGLRGSIAGDTGGAMMRPMATSLLKDAQSIADVAAYLESL